MGPHPFHLFLSLWHSFYPFGPSVELQLKFWCVASDPSHGFLHIWNSMISQFIPNSDTWFENSWTNFVAVEFQVGLWSRKLRHPKDQTLQYSDSCQNGSITDLTSVHPQVSKASSFLTNAHMRNRNATARDLLWSAQKYTAGSRRLHTQFRGGQEYVSTSKYPIWTTVLDSDSDSLKQCCTIGHRLLEFSMAMKTMLRTECECNLLPAFCSSVTQRTLCSCSWNNSGTECGVESLAPFMSSYLIQLHIGSMQVARETMADPKSSVWTSSWKKHDLSWWRK